MPKYYSPLIFLSLFFSFVLSCQQKVDDDRAGVLLSTYPDALAAIQSDAAVSKELVLEGLRLVSVDGASFQMGCSDTDVHCFDTEKPAHSVQITHALNVMSIELTQGLYQQLIGHNPSTFVDCGLDCPVERISWYDAVVFANVLSQTLELEACYHLHEGAVFWTNPTCAGWRLPTEAEWENLAMGGAVDSGQIPERAWFSENSRGQTQPVAQREANGFGLYDMQGNVWEWTWDWFEAYSEHSAQDPRGPLEGTQRIIRGGSWMSDARNTRATVRDALEPEIGASILGVRLVQFTGK